MNNLIQAAFVSGAALLLFAVPSASADELEKESYSRSSSTEVEKSAGTGIEKESTSTHTHSSVTEDEGLFKDETTKKVSFTQTTEKQVHVSPGMKRREVVIQGQNLDQIQEIQVVHQGRPVQDIKVTLGEPQPTKRTIYLSAEPNTKLEGAIELRATSPQGQIEIPSQVVVSREESYSRAKMTTEEVD